MKIETLKKNNPAHGCTAVFCDIDGTLLNSEHKITPLTLEAIKLLKKKEIKFTIVSARSPTCIFPILNEYNFNCPLICFSGALIMDENKKIISNRGFSIPEAEKIIKYIKSQEFDMVYSIYSHEQWVTENINDKRIKTEETIVKVNAEAGDLNKIKSSIINKIFCICNPNITDNVESSLKNEFPDISIARSSGEMIEVMANGISKAAAISEFCKLFNMDITKTAAFGDSFNDEGMLEAVGMGFVMANAPAALKEKIKNITDDNDHDGIYKALKNICVI